MQNAVKLISYVDHKIYEFLEKKLLRILNKLAIFTG